jgi:integration host factor subunit alpha
MSKQTMVSQLAEEMGMTQKETRVLMGAAFEVLSEMLAKGESLSIPKFGIFSVQKHESRKGYNPLLNQWMMLPPKIKTKFKVSETLKKKVNNNG